MLALSFARAAREFFCGMSQCWRIFWVTVHSQLTDETGETVYVLLRPRRADFRTGWPAAGAAVGRFAPVVLGAGAGAPALAASAATGSARRASGSHRRAASLPAAAAPRSWEQGTRSSRAANAQLAHQQQRSAQGTAHRTLIFATSATRRVDSAQALFPATFARAPPRQKEFLRRKAPPCQPRAAEKILSSAPKANFACENAGWRRTFKAGVEGGQAGRRHRDEP